MGQVNQPTNLIDEVAQLRRDVDALRAESGLTSAVISGGGLSIIKNGRFIMKDNTGSTVLFIGPDGSGQQVFQLWRPGVGGTEIFFTQLDIPSGRMFTGWRDFLGHLLFTDDVQTGGMARPYLSVPMYPLFSMAASSVYAYMTIAQASIASETLLWEGRIPLGSHPRINVNGVWGQASGSNSSTYKLYVNGTAIGTWNETGLSVGVRGPFDVSPYLDQTDVTVQLKASASGSGTVAAQVLGCYLRQT